ncbi:bifunctional indole-3-glycerol-phosphate synthase TrpC/phosphoribosylanthranilate isomerase TrpF [Aliikangiella coralliicola]|uniref:Multifunctional fusion protein n=1 Tax=Aliikangiella coralliicola TaxID=2592383 RepID=A0A545TWE7_9GAMM|nr:bifunctional indole-3-glycerol-phosphate synthase TrpC/phosphoribosylanthranilate isomerase TrpF [Aliikangiella coralliicola]TQV81543.1 bifunctional indole-3-glycerol-phosphate synthase TrpC/phosphoribosylanthranilate isomerase TrpF [Aliikangiella coralliicola]
MSRNVLAEIVAHKKEEVAVRKKQMALASFEKTLSPSQRCFKTALSNPNADFIFECKKASPSKGLIRENFDIEEILSQYKDYASAISVLTDEKYFQGSFQYLQTASKSVEQPILCKDFFIDTYQVYEARHYGADAILLMLSVLNDDEYQELAATAKSLNLDILTEVHDETELQRAIDLNAEIIGINNRDLKSLTIDLETTEKLAGKIPQDRIIISESGIETHNDVKRLAPLVNGFLVGSSIMSHQDIRYHCKSLIFGKVKICGITQIQDAVDIDKNGGVFAGFIFYPGSQRYVELETAKEIVISAPLRYVGVFVNESLETVIEHTNQLGLYAVQLHGNESAEYVKDLRTALPNTQIWKAVHVANSVNFVKDTNIDRYLLDTYSTTERGGTGDSFDWRLLEDIDASELILAGGINSDNVAQAISQQTYAIDLSSGVETGPGIKSSEKINQIFKQIRI